MEALRCLKIDPCVFNNKEVCRSSSCPYFNGIKLIRERGKILKFQNYKYLGKKDLKKQKKF